MKTVAIIGLGKLGTAIQQRLRGHYQLIGIDKSGDLSLVRQAATIIIAVKPQSFAELAGGLKEAIADQTVLSVMAGITTERMVESLGTTRIVRTMPSLALSSGASLTAAFSNGATSDETSELLNQWGKIVWLDSEAQFDSFTALAGSGPAYFLELTAWLQTCAERQGFDQATAQLIANQTLKASVAILQDGVAADKLKSIASKQGVTEAALAVFQKQQFGRLITEAVEAARKRSEELSK